MEMHLKLAGFIERKEQWKGESSNATKMDVSQPDVVPEFNSASNKPENVNLPPITIKLNTSWVSDKSVKKEGNS